MYTQVKEKNSTLIKSQAKPPAKPFGLSVVELLGVFFALFSLVSCSVYYFSTLKNESKDKTALQQQVENLKKTEINIQSTLAYKNEVSKDPGKDAIDSLEAFKTGYLKNISQGRIALIEAINNLAKKNSVQLVSGISMSASKLSANSDPDAKSRKQGIEQLSSTFPSLKINYAVAGDYKNLRQFIYELELNKQFITINSISLTSIKDREAGGRGRRGQMVLSGISLAIEMTAYFQG
ncbi:MAG: hypothetical protein AB1757_19430 [Acidobacteriota bacterium]